MWSRHVAHMLGFWKSLITKKPKYGGLRSTRAWALSSPRGSSTWQLGLGRKRAYFKMDPIMKVVVWVWFIWVLPSLFVTAARGETGLGCHQYTCMAWWNWGGARKQFDSPYHEINRLVLFLFSEGRLAMVGMLDWAVLLVELGIKIVEYYESAWISLAFP